MTASLRRVRALPWRVRLIIAVVLFSLIAVAAHYVLHQPWALVPLAVLASASVGIWDKLPKRRRGADSRKQQ